METLDEQFLNQKLQDLSTLVEHKAPQDCPVQSGQSSLNDFQPSEKQHDDAGTELVFVRNISTDPFKGVGVRSNPKLMVTIEESVMDSNFETADKSNTRRSTKDKVTFSNLDLEATPGSGSLSKWLDFYTPPIPNKIPAQPIQSFTYVKEVPSSFHAIILPVSKNIIALGLDNSVHVIRSRQSEDHWEVEEGHQISKFVQPVPYNPYKAGVDLNVKSSSKCEDKLLTSDPLEAEACSEYVGRVCAATLLVSNTISQAKEDYRQLIINYGDPERWSMASASKLQKLSSRWPPIEDFTKEEGLVAIERYVFETARFREDWKYVISFEGAQSDPVSEHYFYEAKFSLPTRVYPIAQVTATLFFHVEVSRVVPPKCPVKVTYRSEISRQALDPEICILRDNALLRILDIKQRQIKDIQF